MSNHALLSASGASRWMACPPSARYELQFEEPKSEYADEGTLAHAIATLLIDSKAFGIPHRQDLIKLRTHELYSEEMWECVNGFADFIIEKVRSTEGFAMLFLEYKLDMREWIKEGFGTTDVMILSTHMLEVVDYKHGKGVPVDAHENKQMMTYALGGLHALSMITDIKQCRMTIYQPRIDNISVYEISAKDLLRWGYEILKPAADIAWEGEGEFAAGDHCRFCKAKSLCPTNAKFNMQLAKIAFAPPSEVVTDKQVVKILQRSASMKRWITSVEEMALKMALEGKKWPGMKLVQGRSVRKYADETKIIEDLVSAGIPEEEIVNKKLTGITDLTKIISKLQFAQLVEPHVLKPDGKPTLVSEEDGRPEFNSNEEAVRIFS